MGLSSAHPPHSFAFVAPAACAPVSPPFCSVVPPALLLPLDRAVCRESSIVSPVCRATAMICGPSDSLSDGEKRWLSAGCDHSSHCAQRGKEAVVVVVTRRDVVVVVVVGVMAVGERKASVSGCRRSFHQAVCDTCRNASLPPSRKQQHTHVGLSLAVLQKARATDVAPSRQQHVLRYPAFQLDVQAHRRPPGPVGVVQRKVARSWEDQIKASEEKVTQHQQIC